MNDLYVSLNVSLRNGRLEDVSKMVCRCCQRTTTRCAHFDSLSIDTGMMTKSIIERIESDVFESVERIY